MIDAIAKLEDEDAKVFRELTKLVSALRKDAYTLHDDNYDKPFFVQLFETASKAEGILVHWIYDDKLKKGAIKEVNNGWRNE